MWGPFMWANGWMFPLMGVLICLGFMLVVGRFARTGGGFGCMGAHGRAGDDEAQQLRREIDGLREEVEQLKRFK